MNENYFEKPTIENCYYAGFIAGDGCISTTRKYGQKVFQIVLKDKVIIENLSKVLETQYRFDKNRKMYIITISSNKICNDLETNWNITSRKTNTLRPPNLLKNSLIKAFLIGLIDADGCICWHKKNLCWVLQITGNSKSILLWSKNKLALLANVTETPNLHKHNKGTSYIVSYQAKKALKIFESLRKIKVPRLERKWSKVYSLG